MSRALITVLLLVATGAAQPKPPTDREARKLVEAWVAADPGTDAGRTERASILERLRLVPPLTPRKEADWRKRIAKAHRKGRRIETSGDHWFWPAKPARRQRGRRHPEPSADRDRGRYIVGGVTRKPKGLLIAFHGGGVGSGDARSAFAAAQPAARALGWALVAPEVLEKTERGWTDAGTEEFVLDLLDAALRTFGVDPDRVYFAGHSMGGYGSWTLGAHHADRVAAVAPSAGAPTPILDERTDRPVDIVEGVIPNLRNLFVAVYQSLDDPRVPPEPNQVAVRLLKQAAEKWGGYEHEYWEVDGRGHAGPPGGHIKLLEKIAPRVRNVVPERVVWQPVLSWKRQFYWLWWDKPVPNAIVVADIDRQANRITITCDQETAGLHVLLDERVLDIEREIVVVTNGVETFRGTVQRTLANLLRTSAHPDPKLQFAARAPAHPGAKD